MQRRRLLALGAASVLAALARPVRASQRPRVVIVGGGFAGATCALTLRRFAPTLEVVLIEPDERYLACPVSNSVIAGVRPFAALEVSRAGLERAGVVRVRDAALALDAQRRELRLQRGGRIRYDRLVFAAGIRMRFDALPGYDAAAAERMPHAWKAGAQTRLLAAQVRGLRPGGRVAISVPRAPYRCPPGPYERASLIAHFLKVHNPRAKVLVFDANNRFSKQALFTEAWAALYAGMIEWIPVTAGGAVERVDVRTHTLHTSSGAHRVDVANVIPPQAPASLARSVGLASDHGWCPVDPASFESTLVPFVHVIGDACIAGAMPKSASSANSQAKHCALAIIAALAGRVPPSPVLHNTCYSLIAPDYGISVSGIYRLDAGELHDTPGGGGTSPTSASASREFRAREARHAGDWYRSILADSFGT
jgi:sulfide dehydrogenase [flavocytochrome c] flavoprotein subunit